MRSAGSTDTMNMILQVVLGTVLSYAFELKQNFSVATVGDFGDIPVG